MGGGPGVDVAAVGVRGDPEHAPSSPAETVTTHTRRPHRVVRAVGACRRASGADRGPALSIRRLYGCQLPRVIDPELTVRDVAPCLPLHWLRNLATVVEATPSVIDAVPTPPLAKDPTTDPPV
jgi:hypothetical protein